MHEVDDELRDIKREIIESRGLVIKTNNLTNALSRRHQIDREAPAGLRATHLVEQRHRLRRLRPRRVRGAQVRVGRAHRRHPRGDRAEDVGERAPPQGGPRDREARRGSRPRRRASQFYELVRQGKRVEVVEGWEAMKKEPLTKAEQAIFADAVERARNELAASSYELGLDKERVQRWAEAASAFEESLEIQRHVGHRAQRSPGARGCVPPPRPPAGRNSDADAAG